MTKIEEIFSAKIVQNHGVVRRSRHDIERLIGFEKLLNYVRKEQFHLIETGDQCVVICNPGVLKIHC